MQCWKKIFITGCCIIVLAISLVACGSGSQSGRSYQPETTGPRGPAGPVGKAPLAPPSVGGAAQPAAAASETAAESQPYVARSGGRPPAEPASSGREPAHPSSPYPEPRQQTSRTLTAGEVDDNHRFDDYLQFRQDYRGPYVYDVDISERYTITVLDRTNRPVPNATVWVSTEYDTVFEGRTYANGQSQFFPRAFGKTGNVRTFRLYVEKDGASQYLDADRHRGEDWVIKLDLNETQPRRVPLDVLFLVDSTGSMSDEIESIKDTLLSVSERIDRLPSRPDLRFGMVTYRDRGDEYVTRQFDFQRDVGRFLKNIERVKADGGGDYPESVNEALHVAVHDMDWRLKDAVRLVVLVADAPPHLDYPRDYDYATEMMEAHRLGIKVFPIASSGLDEQGEYIFRQIAQHTMGKFIFLLYGGTTPHEVGQYTVEQLDDLVVGLVQEELANLGQ